MPSPANEVAVAALGDPSVLSQLVEKVLGAKVPPTLEKVDSTIRFADPDEVRPDIVMQGEAQAWVIVEVQHEDDVEKARRWPLAVAALHDQTRTMGDLVVVAFRRSVARWAQWVAHRTGPLGTLSTLRPVVLLLAGPKLRALLDAAHPRLALFAAWAMQGRHGREARRIVERALEVTETLPEELRVPQRRAIFTMLNEAVRAYLEEKAMKLEDIPEPPGARRARLAWERALDRAEVRGEARGEANGEAKGEAKALVIMLEARGLQLSPAQQERVLTCRDQVTLERWLRRAATATSVEELLG